MAGCKVVFISYGRMFGSCACSEIKIVADYIRI